MSNAPTPSEPRPLTSSSAGDTGRPPADTGHPPGARPADPELREGSRPVPEYVLVEKLGEGGFGQVWKARDDNGFEVALKFLRLDGRAGATELRALEVMKNIRHAHVLPMFRSWQAGGWLVMALELGEKTLYQRLAEAEKQGHAGIPRPELLEYMLEAAKGLDYLHTLNIQHRDVKPQNLLLVGGSVKVADFGLAKLLEHSLASNSGSMTVAYAAPEQFQGLVSPHSDQYSLAVSYCQLCGAGLPFRGTQHEIIFGHVPGQPDLSGLPAAERPAVAKALAKNPEQRWPSCRAFVEALAAAAVGRTPAIPTPTLPTTTVYPRRRSRWYAVAGFVLLGVLAAGIVVALLTPGAGGPPPTTTSAQAGRANPPTTISIRAGRVNPDSPPKADGPGQKPEPVATLRLDPLDPVALRAGESTTVMIHIRHENLPGGIDLTLDGLPAGVKAAPGRLDPVTNTARLTLTADAEAVADYAAVTLKARSGDVVEQRRFLLTLTPAVVVRQRPQPLDCTGEAGVSAADMRKAQEAWARYLGRKVEEEVKIADGVTMTFVLVPPGKFRMGSAEGEEGRDESDDTLHRVVLTEPFDLGKFEVTQAQYRALTGKNPSYFFPGEDGKEKVKGVDTSHFPVERVSWDEADAFGRELTKLRSDKHVYRLPTEAEWEYSCRGGRPSSQPFGIGDGRSLSSLQANFDGNYPYGGADKGKYLEQTCKVGSYDPNALGLNDMHGNVWEWCFDRYGPYPDKEVTNPAGPAEGPARVIRGGGWIYYGWLCRAAFRSRDEPVNRCNDLGFRLARSVPSGAK